MAVTDQSVDLAAVTTGTKCLVVIRAEAGSTTAHTFTDAATGESMTHSLVSSWGRLAYVAGDASNYPTVPADCLPVTHVTKTGAATLIIDSVITATPTAR